MAERIVLLSGLSAGGKTSLGELLKKRCGFMHFDGDVWMMGGDAISGSATDTPPEVATKRPKKLREAHEQVFAKGFLPLFRKEKAEVDAFKEFYTLLCNDLNARLDSDLKGSPGVVITHNVYLPEVRDFIKDKLSPRPVTVVVLDSPLEQLLERRVARFKKQAAESGQSFPEFLDAFMKAAPAFGLTAPTEEACRAMMASWSVGFEPATGEELALPIKEDMDLEAVFAELCALIRVPSVAS